MCTVILKPCQSSPAGKFSFLGEPDSCHTSEFDLKGHTRPLTTCMVSKTVQCFHMRSKKLRSSCCPFSCLCQSAGQERPNYVSCFSRLSQSLLLSFCYDPLTEWLEGLLPFPLSNNCSSLGILSPSHITDTFSHVHPRPAGAIWQEPSGTFFTFVASLLCL